MACLSADMATAIPLVDVHPHPDQPRRDMALTAGFLASIARHGVLVPVVLHPNGCGYVIGEGHRRVAALCELGRDTLEAHEYVVRDQPGDDARVVRVANAMRRDLRPLEWAGIYQADADEGLTHAEIAAIYDVSRAKVGQYLSLRWALEPDVREAVLDGRLGFASARALGRLSDREDGKRSKALRKHQAALLNRCAEAGWRVTSRQIENWVEKMLAESAGNGLPVGRQSHHRADPASPRPGEKVVRLLAHVDEARRLVGQMASANGCGEALLRELTAIERMVRGAK